MSTPERRQSVLLTGGTGFIGRACLRRLLAGGFDVHGITPIPESEAHERLTWYEADLTDAGQLEDVVRRAGASHLLHLAWRPISGDVWSAEDNDEWTDIGRRLVQLFYEHGGRRVVGCGSCGEYDWSDGLCVEDQTPLNPNTRYGRAKAALWEAIGQITAQTPGATAAWGRVFFVYGPNEHPQRLVSSVILSLLKGEPALCSHGRQVRDYLHVDDVADGLVSLLESDASGAFNIACGQPRRVMDVIHEIGNATGKGELIRLGARPAAEHEPPVILGSAHKMADRVGWTASIGLSEGIRQTVDWWARREGQLLNNS